MVRGPKALASFRSNPAKAYFCREVRRLLRKFAAYYGCAARCAEGLCPSGAIKEYRGYAPKIFRILGGAAPANIDLFGRSQTFRTSDGRAARMDRVEVLTSWTRSILAYDRFLRITSATAY